MPARRSIPLLVAAAALLAAPGDRAHAQSAVSGVVYDSINGRPLGDAAVFLWQTPFQGVSDDEGRFRIESVPAGRYSILFFHTQLGEMGVSPGPRPIEVEDGHDIEVELATPSMPTVISSQCLMEDRPEGSGIVAGWVQDGESDIRLGGSAVTLSWDGEGSTPEHLRMRAAAGFWATWTGTRRRLRASNALWRARRTMPRSTWRTARP